MAALASIITCMLCHRAPVGGTLAFMPAGSHWSQTPRQSIEAACTARGRQTVVTDCIDLLRGGRPDHAVLRILAGPAADKFFDGSDHPDVYWFRVWAARGLLWAWDPSATSAVVAALADESWRVRENALKVVTRHLVDDALEAAANLQDDPVPRVRVAARRALIALTRAG